MTTSVRFRRGNTSQHSTFTGAGAELTVDIEKNVVVVHDGFTAGGHYLQGAESLSGDVLALTANNTSFVGSVSAANVVSNSQLQSNLSNYVTIAGLASNVAGTSTNNALYLNGNSASDLIGYSTSAYSNAVSYADNKAANAYSNAVSYVDGKSYVNTAQLSTNLSNYALLSGATFSGELVVSNTTTITGNLIVTGSTLYANVTNLDVKDKNITVAKGAVSNASTDGSGLYVDTSGVSWTYNFATNSWQSNVGITPSSNNSLDLGTSALVWSNVYANNISGTLTTVSQPNITANNTSFVGSISAANVVSNVQLQANIQYFVNTNQLSSNLSNYQTTAGLSANVVKLAANSATYLNGNTASDLIGYSTSAYSNAVSYVDGKSYVNSSQLSSNLSNYAALSGASFTGNLVLSSAVGISANGVYGSNGQALTSNGSAVYWSTIVGTNTAASYLWTNTHTWGNSTSNVTINGNNSGNQFTILDNTQIKTYFGSERNPNFYSGLQNWSYESHDIGSYGTTNYYTYTETAASDNNHSIVYSTAIDPGTGSRQAENGFYVFQKSLYPNGEVSSTTRAAEVLQGLDINSDQYMYPYISMSTTCANSNIHLSNTGYASIYIGCDSNTVSNTDPESYIQLAGESEKPGVGAKIFSMLEANQTAIEITSSNSTEVHTQVLLSNTSLKISNTTVNTQIVIPTAAQWTNNYFLHANGSWVQTSFSKLSDAPSSYTGSNGYLVAVNSTETGLTFTDEIEISNFTLSAQIAPSTVAADSMEVYVTATGTTPNREVALKVKNELGEEITLSTTLV